jgi:membrane protease YdiL (CAAX protease family)
LEGDDMDGANGRAGNGSGTFIRIFNVTWLVVPLAGYLAFEAAFDAHVARTGNADVDLFVFQAALALGVVVLTIAAGLSGVTGWRAPRGLLWPLIAGPLWLGVFSPLAPAMENVAAAPERAFVWIATSFLVAVSEETIFRGFILRGLARSFNTMGAVVLSSLAFGAMHILNIAEGGAPVLIGAQMISAAGVGAVMAAMTLRCGSVWPAIVLHFLLDAIGLSALGGYGAAIQSVELAPSLAISGILFLAWGLAWSWATVRAGKAIV